MCQNVMLQMQETQCACVSLQKHKIFPEKLGGEKPPVLAHKFFHKQRLEFEKKTKKVVRFAVESSLQLHVIYDIQQCKFHQ